MARGRKPNSCRLIPNQIRTVCELYSQNKSCRQISAHFGLSVNPINTMVTRLRVASKDQLRTLLDLDDQELMDIAYPPSNHEKSVDCEKNGKYIPDFAAIAGKQYFEKRIQICDIYQNYANVCSEKKLDPLSTSYFYRQIKSEIARIAEENEDLDLYFIQEHLYGAEWQIDFTGDSFILKTYNGEVKCWILVLTFPASYYSFAGFVSSQSTDESCRVISQAIRYLDYRLPITLVCDNAKAWVTRHTDSDVVYNTKFLRFNAELGLCLSAAPVRKPQRKSSVEASVGFIQNKIKQHPEFAQSLKQIKTLEEHSIALQQFVETYVNNAPFRKSATTTRAYLFNNYEKPTLRKIRKIPDYQAEYLTTKVNRSYHIEVNNHRYSVPYQFSGKLVEVVVTNDFISIRSEGLEIAKHRRCDGFDDRSNSSITTDPTHLSPEHKAIALSKASKLDTPDDVISYVKDLEEGLKLFCTKRLEIAGDNATLKANALSSCNSVIRSYNEAVYKNIFAQACQKVISIFEDPKDWNKKMIMELYSQLLREDEQQRKQQPQINKVGSDQAYLRGSSDNSNLDGF